MLRSCGSRLVLVLLIADDFENDENASPFYSCCALAKPILNNINLGMIMNNSGTIR
jgi:hypothetical protein